MAYIANAIWQFKKILTLEYISALETVEDLDADEWNELVSKTLNVFVSMTMSKVERQNVILEYGIWKSVRDTLDKSNFDDTDDNIELKITCDVMTKKIEEIPSFFGSVDFQAFGELPSRTSEKVCCICKSQCDQEDEEGDIICTECINRGY